jgi:hypothetical protein
MTVEASKHIDQKIASLRDWRGNIMNALRALIHEVDPKIVEEWKWMGTPVWNHDGIVCSANAHAHHVKDPKRIFNAGLEGNAWRAINWYEGDTLDIEGVKGLVRAAIALNGEKPAARKAGGASSVTAKRPGAKTGAAKKPAAKKPPAAKKKAATKRT